MKLSDAMRMRDAVVDRMMARHAAMGGDIFGCSEGETLDRAIEARGEDVGFSHPSFSFRRAPTPSYSRPSTSSYTRSFSQPSSPSFTSFRTAPSAPVAPQPTSSRFASFADPSLQAATASQPFTRSLSPASMVTAPIPTPASLLTAPIAPAAATPDSSRWAQFRDANLTTAVQSPGWTSNAMSPTARLLADPIAAAASASAAVATAKLATAQNAATVPIAAPIPYPPIYGPGDGGGGGGDGGGGPGDGGGGDGGGGPGDGAYIQDPGGPNGPDPGYSDYPAQGPDDYPFPDSDDSQQDQQQEPDDDAMGFGQERKMVRLAYDKLGKAEIVDVAKTGRRADGQKQEELEKVVCAAIARGEDPLAIANRLGKAGVPVMAIKNAVNKCQARTGGNMIRSSSMGAGSKGMGIVALRRKLRGIGMDVKADGDVDQSLVDAVNGIFKGWDDAPKGLQAGDMTAQGLRTHVKLVNQLVDKAIGGAQHLEHAEQGT